MPMNVADEESRMNKYVTEITKRFSMAVQGAYKDDSPEEFIELVCRHLYPPPLLYEMEKAIRCNKSLKKDNAMSLEELIFEAKRCRMTNEHRLD